MGGVLAELRVEGGKSALIVVDMVRGCFGPQHACAPLEKEDAARATEGVQSLLGTFCRDFRVFPVEDACATWTGPELHRAAVSQVAASLGWVTGTAEVAARPAARG